MISVALNSLYILEPYLQSLLAMQETIFSTCNCTIKTLLNDCSVLFLNDPLKIRMIFIPPLEVSDSFRIDVMRLFQHFLDNLPEMTCIIHTLLQDHWFQCFNHLLTIFMTLPSSFKDCYRSGSRSFFNCQVSFSNLQDTWTIIERLFRDHFLCQRHLLQVHRWPLNAIQAIIHCQH